MTDTLRWVSVFFGIYGEKTMTELTEKKTLKLEAGKRYITRQGWITPPLQFDGEFEQTYPFVCGTDEAKSWTRSGKYFSGDEESGREDNDDLVAEFVVDGSVVPGVPEGYRLVRMDIPKSGEHYISCTIDDFAVISMDGGVAIVPIVERIEP
jgi:hypothetical protein